MYFRKTRYHLNECRMCENTMGHSNTPHGVDPITKRSRYALYLPIIGPFYFFLLNIMYGKTFVKSFIFVFICRRNQSHCFIELLVFMVRRSGLGLATTILFNKSMVYLIYLLGLTVTLLRSF